MLIGIQTDAQGGLDRLHRALHLNFHPVAGPSDHLEPVRFGKVDDLVVLLLGGSESCRKLGGSYEVPVDGALGIVDVAQKAFEAGRVAQRQDKVQLQHLVLREPPDGGQLTGANPIPHVVRHDGLSDCGGCQARQHDRDSCKYGSL
jgi:hypothetical protein